jgi:GNAT superfamily N-acetyltransferase
VVHVSVAVPEDAPGIVHVTIASWQTAYAHTLPAEALRRLDDQVAQRTEEWTGWLRGTVPGWHTLVAVSDDGIVGFASGGPSRDDDAAATQVGELGAIYVLPSVWGQGVGRLLMVDFLTRLRVSGFGEATLWVLDDNPRAHRFYETAGWARDGKTKADVLLGTEVREVRYRVDLSA